MKTFAAIVPVAGKARRIVFDACDAADAARVCESANAALVGEAEAPAALPEAYEQKEARRLLGGISRSTLYRELALGLVERLPETRRLLVTRDSIERRKLAFRK